MFTPSKEELEELGFESDFPNIWRKGNFYFQEEHTNYYEDIGKRTSVKREAEFTLNARCSNEFTLNIQSLEDLKTLIRILTPPQ